MNPVVQIQEKSIQPGSSRYYSLLFLPATTREAATSLYRLANELHTLGSASNEAAVVHSKLAWWRDELNNTFNNAPQHPLTRALLPVIRKYDLPHEQFVELLDGQQMDHDTLRYETISDLGLYLYRNAGVLSQLASEIYGYTDRRTPKYAQALGSAIQLTDLIFEVHSAAQHNHVYLPLAELQRFGVSESEILNGVHSNRFVSLMEFQAQRAHDQLAQALALLPKVDRYVQRSGIILARIYLATLDEVAKDGFHVLQHRVSLTPLRKFWIAWRTYRREKRRT